MVHIRVIPTAFAEKIYEVLKHLVTLMTSLFNIVTGDDEAEMMREFNEEYFEQAFERARREYEAISDSPDLSSLETADDDTESLDDYPFCLEISPKERQHRLNQQYLRIPALWGAAVIVQPGKDGKLRRKMVDRSYFEHINRYELELSRLVENSSSIDDLGHDLRLMALTAHIRKTGCISCTASRHKILVTIGEEGEEL